MARIDFGEAELALMTPEAACGEAFFKLGLMYSTGAEAETDRIAAHKWFNVAAARGFESAVTYRQEVADEMEPGELREALRQARQFLTVH